MQELVTLDLEQHVRIEHRRELGVFKHRLDSLLLDGEEDTYNRPFVGYIPEGETPIDNLEEMLDWEKILYKADQQILASDQFATTMNKIA